MSGPNPLKLIPSVDKLLSSDEFLNIIAEYGHVRTTRTIRAVLHDLRAQIQIDESLPASSIVDIKTLVAASMALSDESSLKEVINLTGTVLHTNLGRASLPTAALEAVVEISRGNSNLEFDLAAGHRGDRDDHIEAILIELTGAEAVTIVNNNAAAVLICLNTFALGQEVCISRGELVEIGGSFRIPDVMEKSGCTLKEVGATNRTHLKDYQQALSDKTGLLMKVHTSNYEIRGFTREVSYEELASLGVEHNIPLLADLGSGTLVNLEDYGLEHEPTVQEVLGAGADVVTFSGDKLLGGPQAGIIAGKKTMIDAVKGNPLKRALRVDKMTIAALTEVLKLYRHPEALLQDLPTLRYLARQVKDIRELAEAVLPAFEAALKGIATTNIVETSSQIGSGALPLDQLASVAIEITPLAKRDSALVALSKAFRELPIPVIGRLQDGRLLFDIRTLESSGTLIRQLPGLDLS